MECFISGRELVFHSLWGPLPLGERHGNIPKYQQVYPNKQSLETAGSNYKRAFSDFVQALVKLDRLRRLYFLQPKSFKGEFIGWFSHTSNWEFRLWNVNTDVNFQIETFVSFCAENWEFSFLMGNLRNKFSWGNLKKYHFTKFSVAVLIPTENICFPHCKRWLKTSEIYEANYLDKRSFKLWFLHNFTALISVMAIFVFIQVKLTFSSLKSWALCNATYTCMYSV